MTPLPTTVTARRNARLRAAALATIPLIVFVVAAAPRVWAPDLVPFGRGEASYFANATQQIRPTGVEAGADRQLTPLVVAEWGLGARPWTVPAWVVVRGLLDAVGVALLYLTARSLMGPLGGTLTALLYAASPWAWQLSRDPDGSLGPMLTSAAMLAAVSLIRRPNIVRGAVYGLVLGLLARSLTFGLLVVPLGAVPLAVGRVSWKVGGVAALTLVVTASGTLHSMSEIFAGSPTVNDLVAVQPLFALLLATPMMVPISAVGSGGRILAAVLVVAGSFWITSTMKYDGEVEWQRPAFVIRQSNLPGDQFSLPSAGDSLVAVPTYREVSALTRAMQETADRVETSELVLLNGYLPEPLMPFPYGALLDGVRLDEYGGNVILPLARETAFLAAAEGARPGQAERAVETRRSSSTMRIFTPEGADTGLETFTIRPRPAEDWLARVQTVENGAFADGSRLRGVHAELRGNEVVDVALYWSLAMPTAPAVSANPRQDAVRVRLTVADAPTVALREAFFPTVGVRSDDYLVLMQIRLAAIPDTALTGRLRVTLLDARSESIRTAGGDAYVDVPLRGLSR